MRAGQPAVRLVRDESAGAIGVVVPTGAWPVDDGTRDAVREAARAISRELGAAAWPPPE